MRTLIMMMLFSHLFIICMDIFIYDKWMAIIVEGFFVWLAYYTYMVMTSSAVYAYIILLGICTALGCTYILSYEGFGLLLHIGQLLF